MNIFVPAGTKTFLKFSDIMNVTLRGDDVQGLDSQWDEVLLSVRESPKE